MLVALIPAYNPTQSLIPYVEELKQQHIFKHIIIVNDGSQRSCDLIFASLKKIPSVILLKHAVNSGKGAALKTGLNYVACKLPKALGVVTIDADGQHSIKDACQIAKQFQKENNSLIVGARNFKEEKGEVPFRSLFGNMFTRYTLRLIAGIQLSDTQSGLRGIPAHLIPHLLNIETNGYEFELDMLMSAKHHRIKIVEVPIDTIYIDGNKRSSFRPLWDSLRIYFVLFRFSIIAILSALLDYAVFMMVYWFVDKIVLLALICSRIVSVTFNYLNVRRYAFRSPEPHRQTLPKYLLLALSSGVMAYTLITAFMNILGWHVVYSKIVAEVIMFLINFLVQRDFIFRRPKAS